MSKTKKDSIPKARTAAWREFSRFIRMRDCLATTGSTEYGTCVTCGKAFAFDRLQAGHFVPGRNNSILFDPRNCHAQCIGCNMYGGGAMPRYYAFMRDKYGRAVIDDLFFQAAHSMKLTTTDFRVWAKKFREWNRRVESDGVGFALVVGEELVAEIRERIGR